jgi:long-chain acyl-CoA synthetase
MDDKFHIARFIGEQSKKYAERPEFFSRKNLTDNWKSLTWTEFNLQVDMVAEAFLGLGVDVQKCVGQFSQNMVENLVVDFALYSIRAVMVPIYATSSAQQVEFIVNDAEISVLLAGEQQQYDIAVEVLKTSQTLKTIIAIDEDIVLAEGVNTVRFSDLLDKDKFPAKASEVASLRNCATDEDLACILYTSGTTGNPKGVMLPHSCIKEAMRIHQIRLTSMTDKDISIAFLPLSHVFERMWTYLCIVKGIKIYINLRPIEIQETIKNVRPTLMCAVPRFWEKVYAGVQENLAKMSPFMLGVVAWAVAVGKRHNIDCLRVGKKPDFLLSVKYFIADRLIFAKVKKTIGIENANMLPTAGAKLSDDIAVFMRSIGVPIVYGYGLTESTATVACYNYVGYEIGTVGSAMPDVQVRIGEDNEIQLRGATIFPGYYRNPEATKAAFTNDGWFKTGDAGSFKNGMITLTERIKDLFKTSNGKYIAPQEIETRLVLDKYIEQVAVIGDERNFVTAIIAPAIPAVEEYAQKNGISYDTVDQLLENKLVYSLIEERIKAMQTGMANYELIKKFVLIKKGFSIETGELTNTLKIRRAVITQKYKAQIDSMYGV